MGALTLDELRANPQLTPELFGQYFAKFAYEFRAEVQSPEVFLARKSGDCDDFAILAAEVLKRKGYTPHLIAVRMEKMVHVVCYIEETKSYLDFNQRRAAKCVVPSDGSLSNIARQVSTSFKARWTSVSEFTYETGLKRLVRTVVHQEVLPGEQSIAKVP